MQYPKSEIRKVENGFIVQQGSREYVFDNFVELMIVLGEQYDEKIALELLEECKKRSDIIEISEKEST